MRIKDEGPVLPLYLKADETKIEELEKEMGGWEELASELSAEAIGSVAANGKLA